MGANRSFCLKTKSSGGMAVIGPQLAYAGLAVGLAVAGFGFSYAPAFSRILPVKMVGASVSHT